MSMTSLARTLPEARDAEPGTDPRTGPRLVTTSRRGTPGSAGAAREAGSGTSATILPLRVPRPRTGAGESIQTSLALDILALLDPPWERLEGHRSADLAVIDATSRARAEQFAGAMLRCMVQVVAGERPLVQLLRHCSREVYEELEQRCAAVRAASGGSPAMGRGRDAVRPKVVSTRSSLVRPDALESSAHVRYGERSRALAARFEINRGRWQVVAAEFC